MYFQEASWIGDVYIQRSGFLSLAEENDIVMVFPQVDISTIYLSI